MGQMALIVTNPATEETISSVISTLISVAARNVVAA